jgi:enoyl-CoA hydratase
MSVRRQTDGPVAIVTLDRPRARNAVDREAAQALAAAFRDFDADPALAVAVLTGAGGLELALWCDLRIAARDAVFGVFCRRFGVPLIDGGTIRLPRLIGMSRALDLMLTGRPVPAEEALAIGLANRVVEPGQALPSAIALAHELAALPQRCLRSDRLSAYEQGTLPLTEAMAREFQRGLEVIASGETAAGAARFAGGAGRHGTVPGGPERA